jgi:hypothetical protein
MIADWVLFGAAKDDVYMRVRVIYARNKTVLRTSEFFYVIGNNGLGVIWCR